MKILVRTHYLLALFLCCLLGLPYLLASQCHQAAKFLIRNRIHVGPYLYADSHDGQRFLHYHLTWYADKNLSALVHSLDTSEVLFFVTERLIFEMDFYEMIQLSCKEHMHFGSG